MTYHPEFLLALSLSLKIEGVYSNLQRDKGGETYLGISRVYWPMWSGWAKVDVWLAGGDKPDVAEELKEFYYKNFWCRFQGDKVADISPLVAHEIFDTSVNLDVVDGVRCFQTALNMQNRNEHFFLDLVVDGKLGPKSIGIFQKYMASRPGGKELNENILLKCMNGEQYIMYKAFPDHEYFRGVFSRC